MSNPVLIDRAGLRARGVKLHNSSLIRLENQRKFPKRVKIGASTYWLAEEVDEFIAGLKARR